MSTISKVAERAGVSPTTVSHVINHADRVSKAMRERVQSAIDELGYVPNRQAQSLRTGRTNVIAMLIPDIGNPFFTEMVKTAQSALEDEGFDMLVFTTDVPGGHSAAHGRDYLREIGHRRVDGLIVGAEALYGIQETLSEVKTPTVYVGALPGGAVDSVCLDDFGGSRLMGRFLAEKGHRRVAHVMGPRVFLDAAARARGFEAGLAEGGSEIDPELRFEGSYLEPSGRAAVDWLLDRHGDHLPSAIFFANYLMAVGALAAFFDRGVRIPSDLAVAVFDDLPQFEYLRPRVTRVGNSPAELARHAVRLLLDRLSGRHAGPPRTEIIPCALQVYESA